jgi:hypothetical protein
MGHALKAFCFVFGVSSFESSVRRQVIATESLCAKHISQHGRCKDCFQTVGGGEVS